jgi:ADP-ribose pyrophosphatase
MKFKEIKLRYEGKFLKLYDFIYINRVGNIKAYEVISRDSINDIDEVLKNEPMAVVLFVLDRTHTKVLLNKEFRMAVNEYVINMPAGLIEKGETFEETTARELKEETGLDLVKILDIMPPTYSAVGVSNEKTVCVVCEADGIIGGNPEEDEDIEAFWVDKECAEKLLYDSNILLAARTQMLLYQWINSNKIFKV